MAKFRNAQSYYGNTAEARRRQRANLIPGNSWQKRRMKILRLDCFYADLGIGDKQMIYENFVNERNIEKVPKKELKDEKYIDIWWGQLEIEEGFDYEVLSKQYIYKKVLSWQEPKFRAKILNKIIRCMKKKLAGLYRE